MSSPVHVDVLIVGGGLQGLLILDRLSSEGFSCALVTDSDLGAGQTLHSHGVLNTGFGMFGPEPVNLLRQMVVPDLAHRGIQTYGSWAAILPVAPPGAEQLSPPPGLEIGEGALVQVPEVNLDKEDLVSALARGREDLILRGTVAGFERSGDGRVREVEIGPVGTVLAPGVVIVAAGTGSKALLRRLGAGEPQIEDIKHRRVHVLCVRGPSSTLPSLDVVSPAEQLFIASHERDGVRRYLATPMQFQAPHSEEVPADASTEVDDAFAARGWEAFFRTFPGLGSIPGLEFASYAGFRQDVGDQPGMPMCQRIEGVPNVIVALPSGLLGAWPVALQAATLVNGITEGKGEHPTVPGGGAGVRVGESYEDTAAVAWRAARPPAPHPSSRGPR